MAVYSLGFQSVAAGAGAAYAHIAAGSRRLRIREVGLALNAATGSHIAIGRPANTPVGTGPLTPLPLDINDAASGATVHTTWSTAPTAPTAFFKRFQFPATAGAGLVWGFSGNLYVPASGHLVIWNPGAGTASVLNMYIEWDE